MFTVGDEVFLRLCPIKSVMQFGKRGKLSPKYIGPYEILYQIEGVMCRLTLPYEMSFIHPVFLVSMLRKYIPDYSHVFETYID